MTRRESESDLAQRLQAYAAQLPLAAQTRNVAEAVRTEAAASLLASGDDCPRKQALAASLRVEPGAAAGEWLVVSDGDYGRTLEFGTKNSPERPWLIPALNMVRGLIHNCLRQAQSNE